ncbi:MAG: HNH endonuclease signature motif containing protein, partial [Actinomycetota bacterium]
HIPVEVKTALHLGRPPDFEGVACIDCGRRLGYEIDHFDPRNDGGPTCYTNLGPRCWPCHQEKTKRDREAGKLTSPAPEEKRRRESRDEKRGPPEPRD